MPLLVNCYNVLFILQINSCDLIHQLFFFFFFQLKTYLNEHHRTKKTKKAWSTSVLHTSVGTMRLIVLGHLSLNGIKIKIKIKGTWVELPEVVEVSVQAGVVASEYVELPVVGDWKHKQMVSMVTAVNRLFHHESTWSFSGIMWAKPLFI